MTSATNLLVFRDAHEEVDAHVLVRRLQQAVVGSDRLSLFDALVTAGQFECALADCAALGLQKAEQITDRIADACVNSTPLDGSNVLQCLYELNLPRQQSLRVSDPEGFSYYALHPLDFKDFFQQFEHLPHAAVIGIRSIGTTLSAIAAATLVQQCTTVERITVRPAGHPYNRETHFTSGQERWIENRRRLGATFFVVDEGPGLSGSSFLSVAEALINAGVSAPSIRLIGTRQFETAQLCATDAAERWSRFRFHRVSSRISTHFSGLMSLGGGNWRSTLLDPQTEWPASWTAMETTKYLSEDRNSIFKFEGFGHFGERVRARTQLLYEEDFTPQHANAGEGISKYHFVEGVPLRRVDLSKDILDRIAEYCLFRANAFGTNGVDSKQLKQMTEFNFSQETGRTLESSMLNLETDVPVVSDNRMHPHEWIRSKTGHVLKVDASQHGDDHFFPGPTDITWDLAGAIIEWNMDPASAIYLLDRFHHCSGYDASPKVQSYLIAYSAFRMAYCEMAGNSVSDGGEQRRLQASHQYYRTRMISAGARYRRQPIYEEA